MPGGSLTAFANKMARQAAPTNSYAGQVIQFEPSTREWTMPIDAVLDTKVEKHFVARVNESTGLACLELPPSAGCVVQEDIRRALDDAKAQAEALAMSKEFPAPDLQGMAEILLRYQLDEGQLRLTPSSRMNLFVSLPSPDGKGVVDLSPGAVARFMQIGVHVYPRRAWKGGIESNGPNWRFEIELPLRRPDGNYDVSYSSYCGDLCGMWFKAVMKHDTSGWHVVSAVATAVS